MFGMHHADEGDVVDLVRHVLQARDGGLELTRRVREVLVADVAAHDLVDRRSGVEYLVDGLAGQRRTEDYAGQSPHACVVLSPTASMRSQMVGTSSSADPVVLDVLAVGQIGGVAGELGGQLPQGAQLLGRQGAAVCGSAS